MKRQERSTCVVLQRETWKERGKADGFKLNYWTAGFLLASTLHPENVLGFRAPPRRKINSFYWNPRLQVHVHAHLSRPLIVWICANDMDAGTSRKVEPRPAADVLGSSHLQLAQIVLE